MRASFIPSLSPLESSSYSVMLDRSWFMHTKDMRDSLSPYQINSEYNQLLSRGLLVYTPTLCGHAAGAGWLGDDTDSPRPFVSRDLPGSMTSAMASIRRS